MHTRFLAILLVGATVPACKDDPPPPLPEPNASAAAVPRAKLRPSLMAREVPAYSDATVKRWRIEECFYGAYGLKVSRDAYLASLGPSAGKGGSRSSGKEPSDKDIPSFGDFSEDASPAAPAASASGKPSSAAPAQTGSAANPLGRPTPAPVAPPPYARFLGSCAFVARSEQAPGDGIDKAVADFEPYASQLSRTLMAAHRYFASGAFNADKFEQGKKVHAELIGSFALLDDKLGALAQAFSAWQAGLPKPSEKLDHAGELAAVAMDRARAVVALALADKVDDAAMKKAIDELVTATSGLEQAGKDDPKAPHPAQLVPGLGHLAASAAQAERALKDGKIPTLRLYRLTEEMAELCEANHRALGAYLRMTGQVKPAGPLTTLRPSLRGRPAVPAIPREEP